MKNILFIILFILNNYAFAAIRYVPCVGEGQDIHNALLTAVNACNQTGDSVYLPYGHMTMSQYIYTTKEISFFGTRRIPYAEEQTTLYRSKSMTDTQVEQQNAFIWLDINKRTLSNITMANITFKCKSPSMVPKDGGSMALSVGVRIRNCNGFVIKNCKFENFGESAVRINHYDDQANGLIAKCTFINNAKDYTGRGYGYGVVVYGQGLSWVPNLQFGTANSIFIEDCKFEGGRHGVASNYGSLYVCRYNEFKNIIMAAAIDVHESSAAGVPGGRLTEIYNNKIENDKIKIKRVANAAQRNALAPYRKGDFYCVQEDIQTLFVSTGTAAGNWDTCRRSLTYPFEYKVGGCATSVDFPYSAIGIRGGVNLVWGNEISGYYNGIHLEDHYTDAPPYPIPYGLGWESSGQGVNHSGTDSPQGDGDTYIWNNKVNLYDQYAKALINNDVAGFKDGRDFHYGVAKSEYTPYIYPHPKNN